MFSTLDKLLDTLCISDSETALERLSRASSQAEYVLSGIVRTPFPLVADYVDRFHINTRQPPVSGEHKLLLSRGWVQGLITEPDIEGLRLDSAKGWVYVPSDTQGLVVVVYTAGFDVDSDGVYTNTPDELVTAHTELTRRIYNDLCGMTDDEVIKPNFGVGGVVERFVRFSAHGVSPI